MPYVEAIEKILNNLETYKDKCRKRVLNGFTINQMVDNMENQFKNIVANSNKNKTETGIALGKALDVCKELITKNYISFSEEYNWLCNQVNMEYFGEAKGNQVSSYDYFETPIGKLRLKAIAVTKKLHIYEQVRDILRKFRKMKDN